MPYIDGAMHMLYKELTFSIKVIQGVLPHFTRLYQRCQRIVHIQLQRHRTQENVSLALLGLASVVMP